MRFLLVTNAHRFGYSEPLGVMHLVSALEAEGHEARLAFDDPASLEQIVGEWKPDVVGYSAMTGDQDGILALNRRLKEVRPFFAIMGGPHPTHFPEVIEQDAQLDAICRGEGEEAIVSLAEALGNGSAVERVPNLWVRSKVDGTIHRNEVCPLAEDIDALPPASREAYYSLYNRPLLQGAARFMAGRGCPYNCTYCFNKYYYELYKDKGPRVRWRSPAHVVREIAETRKRYPFQIIAFCDDCFPYGEAWLTEFRDLYTEQVGLPFVVNERVERITPAVCRLLREAGCHCVFIGVETGNETLRHEKLHRYMSNEEMLEAGRNLREAGLVVGTNNLVGIPGETMATALETLDMNIALRASYAGTFFFQPFPRTDLCRIAIGEGLYDGNLESLGTYDSSAKGYDIPDITRLRRIRALIVVTVFAPFLRPLAPFLAGLPLGRVYGAAARLTTGYCMRFRIFPARQKPGQLVRQALQFLFKKDPF